LQLCRGVVVGLVPATSITKALMRQYYVYILASRAGGALYVGVTNDLVRRVCEHKMKLVPGHTKRYQIDQLVYFEVYDSPSTAIQREKNMKHWPRVWKTRLIGEMNPTWRDLYDEIASP
jgi:putative endonuclease